MKVYKFMSAKWAKEAILSKRLKISIIPTLNDPWEGNALSYTHAEDKEAWKLKIDTISQTLGMICFSKEWTDPVLWSHYSEQHQGIALGFELDSPLMTSVNYRKTLIKYDDIRGLDYAEETNFLIDAISTKYSSWAYEKEVRLFADLKNPDPKIGHFFNIFNTEMRLTDVIFGARYSNHEERLFILASIKDYDDEVKSWKAALGDKNFQMARDQIWQFTTR